MKRHNKTKALEKTLGGKWTFCGGFSGRWECDDGRAVQRCAASDYSDFGESFHTEYWLYKPSGSPERAEKYLWPFTHLLNHVKSDTKEIELERMGE